MVDKVVSLDDFRKKKVPLGFSEKKQRIEASLGKLEEQTQLLLAGSKDLSEQTERIFKQGEELLEDVQRLAKTWPKPSS